MVNELNICMNSENLLLERARELIPTIENYDEMKQGFSSLVFRLYLIFKLSELCLFFTHEIGLQPVVETS